MRKAADCSSILLGLSTEAATMIQTRPMMPSAIGNSPRKFHVPGRLNSHPSRRESCEDRPRSDTVSKRHAKGPAR